MNTNKSPFVPKKDGGYLLDWQQMTLNGTPLVDSLRIEETTPKYVLERYHTLREEINKHIPDRHKMRSNVDEGTTATYYRTTWSGWGELECRIIKDPFQDDEPKDTILGLRLASFEYAPSFTFTPPIDKIQTVDQFFAGNSNAKPDAGGLGYSVMEEDGLGYSLFRPDPDLNEGWYFAVGAKARFPAEQQ